MYLYINSTGAGKHTSQRSPPLAAAFDSGQHPPAVCSTRAAENWQRQLLLGAAAWQRECACCGARLMCRLSSHPPLHLQAPPAPTARPWALRPRAPPSTTPCASSRTRWVPLCRLLACRLPAVQPASTSVTLPACSAAVKPATATLTHLTACKSPIWRYCCSAVPAGAHRWCGRRHRPVLHAAVCRREGQAVHAAARHRHAAPAARAAHRQVRGGEGVRGRRVDPRVHAQTRPR